MAEQDFNNHPVDSTEDRLNDIVLDSSNNTNALDFDVPTSNTPNTWLDSLKLYLQPQMIRIFFLGFASGLPFLLTGSTISARLTDASLTLSTIGLFSLVGLPYSIKFLWAPFIDKIRLPGVKTHLQHRKSWVLLTQLLLFLFILGMGLINEFENTYLLAIFAVLTAFASSAQDVVIDALRVEMLPPDDQGAAAASSVFGYRIGMLVAGAGALALAAFLPWNQVYLICACLVAVGAITTISIQKLDNTPEENTSINEILDKNADITEQPQTQPRLTKVLHWLKETIVDPFQDFLVRKGAFWILAFILLFKLGDALAGSMTMPFYLKIGYDKLTIVGITKIFGLIATLGGTFLGGILVKRMKMQKVLLLAGILMLSSNFVFSWLALAEHNTTNLTIAITVENVTGGIGTAAFVAYMSSLCHLKFTATQYALLSSLSSVGRTLFGSSTGFIVEAAGWPLFFAITAMAAIPSLIVLGILPRVTDPMPKKEQDSAELFK